MKTTSASSSRLLMAATLLASQLNLTSCASQPQVKVIPADRMIRALPNGHYEVTPAWLKDRYEYERAMKEQLGKNNRRLP